MALAFLESVTTRANEQIIIDDQYSEEILAHHDLVIQYRATPKSSTVIICLTDSNKEAEQIKVSQPLFTEDENGTKSFAGPEHFWNNRLRHKALQEGLEHHLPKVLYLLRPETAYIGALHYVAKEVGGAKSFLEQRSFIFQNPGIAHVLEIFWARLLEISWSGGFSPGITKKEKNQLLLAITECFSYTARHENQRRGEHSLLVPHLDEALLEDVGVFFPSLQRANKGPTEEGIRAVKENLKRTSSVAPPCDTAGYLQCHICSAEFASWAEAQEHANKSTCAGSRVACEGCGISFESSHSYKIHLYTFCKQGPLTGAKCAVCNTKGPACLCQVHWGRTYQLAASFWEGGHDKAQWLTEQIAAPSLIILMNTYTNVQFIDTENAQQLRYMESPPVPIPLNQRLWEPSATQLPNLHVVDEEEKIVVKNGSDTTLREMGEQLSIELQCTLRKFKIPEPAAIKLPMSTRKGQAKKSAFYRKLAGNGGITLEGATEEDFEVLTSKIENMKEELSGGDTMRKRLMMAMSGKTYEEMKADLENLEQLNTDIAAALLGKKQKSFKQRLSFSDHGSEESLVNMGDTSFTNPLHDKNEQKLHKAAQSSSGAEANEYCRNESHKGENPPYRVFPSKELKTAHLARNHKCTYSKDNPPCPFFYEMEKELGHHIMTVHKVKKPQAYCPLCNAVVKQEHMSEHKEQMHSECSSCKKWFLDLVELKAHWETGCRPKYPASAKPSPVKNDLNQSPDIITLANVAEVQPGHENYLTQALGLILDAAVPETDENASVKRKARELITSYSSHQAHKANIERNPWVAHSTTIPFLTPPSFVHAQGAKERSFEKALTNISQTDLSPTTSRRFDNYLLADALNHKITGFTKQYALTESSAVYLLTSHLSQDNNDTLRSTYHRPPTDLSYQEILSCLQRKYYSIDLRTLRDAVANLRRGQNEAHLAFYNRIFKLCSLAAINLEESAKNAWVESMCRKIFFKSLDNALRLEVEAMESKSGQHMSSAQLLETYIARANLKASPLDLDDSLLQVARVKTEKQNRINKHTKKVNVITSHGQLDIQGGKEHNQKRGASAPKGDNKATKSNSMPYKDIRLGNQPSDRQARQQRSVGFNEASKGSQTYRGTTARSQGRIARLWRDSPTGRLNRPPSPPPRRAQQGQRKQTGGQNEQTRRIQAPEKEGTLQLMNKLHLTTAKLAEVGLHCFACGMGHKMLGGGRMHKRNQCRIQPWNEEPHNCKQGLWLMHHPRDCPVKKTINRVKKGD